MHAIVGLSVSQARTNWSDKWCTARKWTSCVEAVSDPSSVSPMSSQPLPIIPQITLKHNKMSLDTFTYLFITHLMVRHWQICCILIQKADSNRPSPTRFLSRKCLWSFLSGGNCWRTRGWVADWRQAVISLSPPGICPLLPTFF